MIKKIAIVVAMSSEFDLVKHILNDAEIKEFRGISCVEGNLNDKKIVLIQSGIGKVNAAIRVTELIDNEHPDLIINSGVAGGIGANLHVGDVVVGTECVYHDVWCGEGEWGQVQGFPLKFKADKTLVSAMERIKNINMHFGLICSGDQFISDIDALHQIKTRFPDGLAVDMESAAMSQTCYLYQVPFISMRIISDTPGMETDNTAQYRDFFAEAPKQNFEILKKFVETI